jgi:unsaturated chondroitin disaccharide hydrolase
MYTTGGKWDRSGELWTDWCGGFFAGMMWLFHERTGDPWWREQAEHYSKLLEPRQHDRNVHDLGFIFLNTYSRWYALTDDAALRDILIQAGRTLAMRMQKGDYLASFIGPESLFIDIMMNVPIILYAADLARDDTLLEVGITHARTSARYLVRDDGSTAHEAIFDLDTGAFIRESTHQGYRPDSCWARGLAWSLYGFGTTYRYTEQAEFLETAQRCADYYVARAPAGGVPYWDFDAPVETPPAWDSSAGAIAASGLWQLADLTPDPVRAERYRETARDAMTSLTGDAFLAQNNPAWEGVLYHGVYHRNKGLGVDESVMWGDFFFTEAVVKLLTAAGSSGAKG